MVGLTACLCFTILFVRSLYHVQENQPAEGEGSNMRASQSSWQPRPPSVSALLGGGCLAQQSVFSWCSPTARLQAINRVCAHTQKHTHACEVHYKSTEHTAVMESVFSALELSSNCGRRHRCMFPRDGQCKSGTNEAKCFPSHHGEEGRPYSRLASFKEQCFQ